MYKKNVYKFKPKVSKKRKDVHIYLATQGKIKTFDEFKKFMEQKRKERIENEEGVSQD